MPRCGLFLAGNPDSRHTQRQTKHEAYVGVAEGQSEKNARSWGVWRSVGVAVVSWPPQQMACRKPFLTRTEALKKKREGGFEIGRSALQLKGGFVLLFCQNSITMHRFSSWQKANMCVFGPVCWHAFEPFILAALLCLNKLFKKSTSSGVKRKPSLCQVRPPALC